MNIVAPTRGFRVKRARSAVTASSVRAEGIQASLRSPSFAALPRTGCLPCGRVMRIPWRFFTGLTSFLVFGVVGLGVVPCVARAPPPTLTALGQTSRHLTASWFLAPGTEPRVIEAAVSPETSSDGYFFSENVREFSSLEDAQTSYVGNSQLEPWHPDRPEAALGSPPCLPGWETCCG